MLVADSAGVERGSAGLVIVESPQPSQIPAPASGGVTQQALVANSVQRSLTGADTNHCVSPSLPCWPGHLPPVETRAVALLGSDAVSALGNGVTPHHQAVAFIQHNVEGLVTGTPAMLLGH